MSYDEAKARYAAIGVDTDAVLQLMSMFPISLDMRLDAGMTGFRSRGGAATAGSDAACCAGTPEELMRDIDLVLSLCPGSKKLVLHPNYAIFTGENGGPVDRDGLKPEHFGAWVDFCKKRGIGADFTPDFSSHPMCDPLTLSSPDKSVRRFWIDHGKASLRIAEYLSTELDDVCFMNIETGDGFNALPADLLGPGARYRHSLDEILSEAFDPDRVKVSIESGCMGSDAENHPVASDEFCISYAAMNNEKCIPVVSAGPRNSAGSAGSRISALLTFFDEIAVHFAHPLQSSSGCALLFDDDTRGIMTEMVRNDAICRVHIALDFYDVSVDRLAALITGYRNAQKALLYAMLMPNAGLKALQDKGSFSELMVVREQIKTMPFGDVWDAYCMSCGVPCEGEWFPTVQNYEKEVLMGRR